MSNLIIFGNHVLSSRGRAGDSGGQCARAHQGLWFGGPRPPPEILLYQCRRRRRLRASPLVCSSSSTPFREIQTDTGSVGLELGGWWRLRQAGGHGWSSFHERRRGVSGRGTSSLRPSSFVPIVTDPMSSHSAFASPPWCARVRATRASETFGLVVPSPLSLPPSLSLLLPSCLPPFLSFPLSSPPFPSLFLLGEKVAWHWLLSLLLSLLTTNSSKVRLAYQFPCLYLVNSSEDSFSSHPPCT